MVPKASSANLSVAARKVLVMGLPGSGKTSLARELAPLLGATLFNADEVRENVNRDLGFSLEDRIEHARRIGWLCDRVAASGGIAIADFVCPTTETRAAFGEAFTVWVDRISESRFEDTNAMFMPPDRFDVRVTVEGSPRHWAERILKKLRRCFNHRESTALIVGRFQPFHDGHRQLIEKALSRVDQVCIGVRDTFDIDSSKPLTFFDVRSRIETGLRHISGKFIIVPVPNISHVFYGREVGYAVERLDLEPEIESISATKIREHFHQPTK